VFELTTNHAPPPPPPPPKRGGGGKKVFAGWLWADNNLGFSAPLRVAGLVFFVVTPPRPAWFLLIRVFRISISMSDSNAAAYDALITRVREAALLGSCAGLLGWDERTYMPKRGAGHRAEQMALLARLGHEMITAPIVGELIAKAEA